MWRKSSFSNGSGGACVEVAGTRDRVRDSKNADGPVLRVDLAPLLAGIRSGRFTR